MGLKKRIATFVREDCTYDSDANDTTIRITTTVTYPAKYSDKNTDIHDWHYLWVEGDFRHLKAGDMIVLERTTKLVRKWAKGQKPKPYWRIVESEQQE